MYFSYRQPAVLPRQSSVIRFLFSTFVKKKPTLICGLLVSDTESRVQTHGDAPWNHNIKYAYVTRAYTHSVRIALIASVKTQSRCIIRNWTQQPRYAHWFMSKRTLRPKCGEFFPQIARSDLTTFKLSCFRNIIFYVFCLCNCVLFCFCIFLFTYFIISVCIVTLRLNLS